MDNIYQLLTNLNEFLNVRIFTPAWASGRPGHRLASHDGRESPSKRT
jgi:hypothetical protein